MLEEPQIHRSTYATCPTCGRPAVSDVTRENRGVMLADYMCLNGHIWSTKWLAAA